MLVLAQLDLKGPRSSFILHKFYSETTKRLNQISFMFCECVARFVGRINPAAAYPVSVASYSILNDRIKIYLLSMTPVTRMVKQKHFRGNDHRSFVLLVAGKW